MKQSVKHLKMLVIAVSAVFLWTCENKPDNFGKVEYDSSKRTEVHSFEPESGGLATKVFISGSNFGTDLSKIKVYFGDMRAPVVGSDGNHLYTISPRQPDDGFYNISVVVHDDSVSFVGNEFKYNVMYIIRTISGRKGTEQLKEGKLSEAEYHQPSTLAMDNNGNLFMSHWRVPFTIVRINEEEDIVERLMQGSIDPDATYALGAPTVDADGVVSVINDNGRDYYTFDPKDDWSPRQRSILPAGPGGTPFSVSTAHSLAAHPVTGELYTRYQSNGHLIKIDPITKEGSLVIVTPSPCDSYLVFDPVNPNLLYITYSSLHFIGTYNIETKELKSFAGRSGTPDWQDGPVDDARFNNPNQLIVAPNGNLYVADRGNHCIRMITLDGEGGGVVSTIIGKGGVPGYQDGNPEDALFNNPRGVAVTPQGDIYITDLGNNVIRKLTFE